MTVVDHFPVACAFVREGTVGFQAGCLCGWRGRSVVGVDGRGLVEARTAARVDAERHACWEEDRVSRSVAVAASSGTPGAPAPGAPGNIAGSDDFDTVLAARRTEAGLPPHRHADNEHDPDRWTLCPRCEGGGCINPGRDPQWDRDCPACHGDGLVPVEAA